LFTMENKMMSSLMGSAALAASDAATSGNSLLEPLPFNNMTNPFAFPASTESTPSKKRKTPSSSSSDSSVHLQHVTIEEIELKKNGKYALYTFKIGYNSKFMRFSFDNRIMISINYQDGKTTFADFKEFIEAFEKDETCNFCFNGKHRVSYNSDSKDWLHIISYPNIPRFKPKTIESQFGMTLNDESREDIIKTFKTQIIDKINHYMEM